MDEDLKTEQGAQPTAEKSGPLQTVVNAVGIFLCVLFIPVIIINVVMIVRSYVNPDKIASVFGFSPVIVLSGSMSPAFEAGDMVILRETDPSTLEVGDVICYLEEESAVTHRIIEIQQENGETLYITRGDANNVEDLNPVAADQIQGKFTGIVLHGLGDFAMFLQSTPGLFLFIGGPVLLFVFWDGIRRMLQSRRDAAQRQELEEESESKKKELEAMEEELRKLRAQVKEGNGAEAGPETKDGE